MTEINRLKAENESLTKQLSEYQKAYNLLMDYFDYLPDEDKPSIDKQLKKLNL